MSKINNWIDNSPAVHWFMFMGSIMLATMSFQTKHFVAVAFYVGASLVFFPPMQKNINGFLGHKLEKRYYMNIGIIMLIIALVALVKR